MPPLLAHARGLWAARQRSLGRYTRATLAAYLAAWRQQPTPARLLAWLAFRRDMGLPVPARFVPALRDGLARLEAPRRRAALGLLAEARPESVGQVKPHWLADAAPHVPPVAANVLPASPLARVARLQADWRHAFAAEVARAANGRSVQVVGNAAGLRGQSLGAAIDAADLVVRFNQFANGPQWAADVGQRTDVWVVSPGYDGPTPAAVRWVVVSGPDMLFRLQDWRCLGPLLRQGTPVLTVPLPQWRACVATLQAPPSAGVLMLQWLRSLNTGRGWAGIRAAGMGFGAGPRQRPYHLALPQQKPGHRHAWPAEAAWLARWQAEGLRRLDAGAAHG